MPYSTGETPRLGDCVKSKSAQFCTVVSISKPSNSACEVVGVVGDAGKRKLELVPATELALISRCTSI